MDVKKIAALTFAALLSAACSESPVSTLPNVGKAPGFKMSTGVPSVTMVPAGRTLPITEARRSALSMHAASPSGSATSAPALPGKATILTAGSAVSPGIVWFATDGTVTLFQMEGTAWNGGGATILQIPSPWKLVAAADLTGDDGPDLIWEATTDGTRAVTFMNGSAYGGSYQMMFVIPPEWTIVGGGDFNFDDKADLVLHNTVTGDNGVLFLNGTTWTGVFSPLPNFGTGARFAAVGDMNGDHRPDLITQDVTTGQPSVYYLTGTTVKSSGSIAISPGADWTVAAVNDFNADGKGDLVFQNTSSGLRSIWLMNGLVRTSEVVFTSVSTVWTIVAAPVFDWIEHPPIHFKVLSAHHFHTCGLDNDGAAFCWGSDVFGLLGTGSPPPINDYCTIQSNPCISRPIPVAGGHVFSDLSVGSAPHTCALASQGAFCWGEGADGQLGNGISGEERNAVPIKVQSASTYTSLGVGGQFTCGLTTLNKIDCWGSNQYGQLGDTTTTEMCSGSRFHSEPILCSTSPRRVSSSLDFTKVSVGYYHACALGQDGAAFCWGWNDQGGLGAVATSQCGSVECNRSPAPVVTALRFTDISVGTGFTCAISTVGGAYCWGVNTEGQLGTGSFSARETHPVAVSSGSSFVKVFAGDNSACALDAGGNAFCWGDNEAGEVGDGTTANRVTPVPIGQDLKFTFLSVGAFHACGIATDGYAYCWGYNSVRQLGINRDGIAIVPTRVAGQ